MINILLYALRIKVTKKNTYISYARKGFDIKGNRIQPTSVLPSAAALSRMQTKTARLYEQGASNRRIVRYWVRWLGWAIMATSSIAAHSLEHLNHGYYVNSKYDLNNLLLFSFVDNLDSNYGYYGVFQVMPHQCYNLHDPSCNLPSNCKPPTTYPPSSPSLTTNTSISSTTRIDTITNTNYTTSRADTTSNWCLIKDGASNFWAIDRNIPTLAPITTTNINQRVRPCLPHYYFDDSNGCRNLISFDNRNPTLTVNDYTAHDISSLLAATIINWLSPGNISVLTPPTKGTLNGFPHTLTTINSGSKTPTGLTYTPNAGESGSDSFVIKITAGSNNDSVTVNVTITASSSSGSSSSGNQPVAASVDSPYLALLLAALIGGLGAAFSLRRAITLQKID